MMQQMSWIFWELVRKGNTSEALVLLAGALADGKDVRQFMRDWVNHYRNLLMVKFIRDPQDVINLSAENIDRLRRQAQVTDLDDINRGILELSMTMQEAKWSTQPRILLELVIVRLSSVYFSSIHHQDSVYEQKPVQRRQVPAAAMDVAKPPAGLQEAPAAKTESTRPEDGGDGQQFDYDAVWRAVFNDGEKTKGSFYMIGRSARLTAIKEHSFTVSVSAEHVKKYAESNRQLLEQLMEKHTGRKRAMDIVVEGETGRSEPGMTVEKIASEAGKALGIDIEIQ